MQVYENEPFALASQDRDHLQTILGGYLQQHANGWVIRRVVGHLSLPSGEVLHIRSRKASAASMLTWAAYCDPALHALRFLGKIDDSGAPGSIAGVTSWIFAAELLRAAARNGLMRHYERRTVSASNIRGRIDFPRAIRHGGQLSPIPCITWERTSNTAVNRFLAAALKNVIADSVMRNACARELPRLAALLGGIRPEVDPVLLAGTSELPRNLQHLEVACSLARMILRNAYLGDGDISIGAAFLLNIEALFERTVTQAFREAGIHAVAKHPVSFQRKIDGNLSSHAMELDLFVPQPRIGPLVIDAKYKTSIASANLQQVVTYCYLTGARKGFLVVPAGYNTAASFAFNAGNGAGSVIIEVVELITDARSVDEWRDSSAMLVASIMAKATT